MLLGKIYEIKWHIPILKITKAKDRKLKIIHMLIIRYKNQTTNDKTSVSIFPLIYGQVRSAVIFSITHK